MSKFIDKLKLAAEGELKPMGFRMAAQGASPKSRMLLVAGVTGAEDVAGADAGLLKITSSSAGAKTLKKVCQVVPDIPWGVWLGETAGKDMGPVAEAGGDFVVFPVASPSRAVLEEKKLGKILAVEPELEPGLLRAIDDLPVDAVLITAEDSKDYPLTWNYLMRLRRSANLLSKPLLAPVPSSITASELEALWEVGVRGVLLESPPPGKIAELRQTIDKLVFPSPSRRRKAEVLVPRLGGEAVAAAEEEEEAE